MNQQIIDENVTLSLREDVGSGDLTAQLIPADKTITATIFSREPGVLCGIPWVETVYQQLGGSVELHWYKQDSDVFQADEKIVCIQGNAQQIMTGERCALNWLQTLSGTATTVANYVSLLADFPTALLDTRKTIPCLRYAQKYAVRCGGGNNHRMGLYDAFLIKENHIASCGSITTAVNHARKLAPEKRLEVEVETLDELQEALKAGVEMILLDNFNIADLKQAVAINQGKAKLEFSGNVGEDTICDIAAMGVDYISVGGLTKHVDAIDLSLVVL